MKSGLLQIALGIITSIGGFLEVGSIATAAQAGASFRYGLIWSIVLGTLCLVFLIEMSGRLAAVSKHTVADAVRERFGFDFAIWPRIAELLVNFLVLGAEIAGVCLGLKVLTGIDARWWAVPVALILWFALWVGTLDIIENATSGLGLLTIAFVVAAVKMHPDWIPLARGAVAPVFPPHDQSGQYWFTAVSILGATISPYMFYFYSSGAVEEGWKEKDLPANRVTAIVGMSFGALMSIAVLVVSAQVFNPRGIDLKRYEQIALVLTPALHKWGWPIFGISLAVCCFGAAVEISLASAYSIAQTFGWNWGEDEKPAKRARFSLTYTILIFLSIIPLLLGVDPLKQTIFSMALTAIILPLAILPFVLLLNDETFVGKHRNGPIGNFVVTFTIFMACIVALVTIPLEIVGGS
ncbi:MAG TPA: divalent metal cation transporter [Thermoanaerobaculia bacterium]|nr:divalent metal cation transporter [Thermoanaerobaculia bacterium]